MKKKNKNVRQEKKKDVLSTLILGKHVQVPSASMQEMQRMHDSTEVP